MKKQSKTDWKGLALMTDEEIDYSDIPSLPDAFFNRARVWHPQPKVAVTVELDADIMEWFRLESEDWEARIQAVLRLYVEANKAYLQTQGADR
jgi:uncharacterized protein (DUF4415 family)